MKLTTDTIRQLIKEELTNLLQESPQVQQVFTILDGSWDQGMLIASALDEQDRNTFMQLAGGYVVDKLKELQGDLDASHRRRKTGQYFKLKDVTSGNPQYQIEMQTYMYESFLQDSFDKSFVKLRKEDGMFDVDLHIKPSSNFIDYLDFKRERYQEEGLDLEEVIDMLRNIYTQGGTIK